MVGADARLVAKGRTAVAVGHEQAAILEAKKVRGESPDAAASIRHLEGVRVCPGASSVR